MISLNLPQKMWADHQPLASCEKSLKSIDERIEKKWKLQFFRFLKRTGVTEIFLQASKPLTRATPYAFHQENKIELKNHWFLLYANYDGISNSEGIYYYAETLPDPEITFLNLRLLKGARDYPSDDAYFLKLAFHKVEEREPETPKGRQRIVTYETLLDGGAKGSYIVRAQLVQDFWPLQPKTIRTNPWINSHVVVNFEPMND